jgi:Fe-coproporphyrin III synthase
MNRIMSFFRTIYRNNKDKPVFPRYLTWLATYRCNSRCIMCDCWKRDPQNELSFYEIRDIFSSFPKMDFVRITGGEPFLRKDLPGIVKIIHQHLKPLFLHITTNGLMEERIVRFCQENGPDNSLCLLVSLDGMKDKHDHVRGIPGAWEKTVSTLKALRPVRKKTGLKLAVNQTIVDQDSIAEHKHLKKYLDRYDIPVHAVLAYDVSATYHTSDNINVAPVTSGEFVTFGDFSCEQISRLLRAIEGDLKYAPFLNKSAKKYYWTGVKNRLLLKQGFPNPPCVALGSHLRILPDGRIPTCQFNSCIVGDLRADSLEKIWLGEKTEKQRQWVKACPGCWAECEVLPNAVYSGDLLKKFKIAWQKPLV